MMVVHIDLEGGRAKYIGHARSIDVATQELLWLMDNIKLVSIACGLSCMEKKSLLNTTLLQSKEEYEASVCLCGSQVCRGSFLNLTGEGAFQKILKEDHGILNRHQMMLEACELDYESQEEY